MSDFGPAPLPTDSRVEEILDQLDGAQKTINYGVNDGVATVYALAAADDGDSGPAPRRELTRLTRLNDELETVAAANPVSKDAAKRVDVMQQLTAAINATRTTLASQGAFPSNRPEMVQARTTQTTLFGDGGRVQRKRHRDVWLLADRIITKVDADADVAYHVELLVGPWALDILRPLHASAGRLLGITAPLPPTESADLLEKLREHREQAAAYERAVLGEMDAQDPASVRRTQELLAPLIALRQEYSGYKAPDRAEALAPQPVAAVASAPADDDAAPANDG